MTRGILEQELRGLRDEVLLLGSMVEKAIQRSMEALQKRDQALSQKVVEEDALVNAERFRIEERCIQVIATQ
ncbi:MAG TPA: PhoU domain-containing protein, partial [Dehalococcoidia bacterium]|nr:PhoU domain-containing protein [Dehalococcoidia bacterium]